jgi:exopolyphosphatase / guanosine-5'-triphosphate,3'-diphosphate pyrophosphatase
MRAAVLDLGTNTFNLLVGELNPDSQLHILFSSKISVKIGEGGINKGEILPAAYTRGINAIAQHFKTIRKYRVEKIKAFGTSALRTARNGKSFISEIKAMTGIEVEIISGDIEAELIYYGVRQTYNCDSGKYLILDIGGGSNECIIADNKKIYWKKSYPLGIARLLERFKISDPITTQQLEEITKYFTSETTDLRDAVLQYNITTLVGASGAFETFKSMIHEIDNFESQTSMFPESIKISDIDFQHLYQKLILSTEADRRSMKGLEPIRIEMIVLAIHFVKFVTDLLKISQIVVSNFSLKEGATVQLLKH